MGVGGGGGGEGGGCFVDNMVQSLYENGDGRRLQETGFPHTLDRPNGETGRTWMLMHKRWAGYTTIATWNVRGLNTYTKRYRVSTYMRRMGIRIAMLQETHLGEGESQKLQKKWRGQLYSSTYSRYARGVSIWIAPQVPFRLLGYRADVGGRYILVHGTLDGEELCLINVYAPIH